MAVEDRPDPRPVVGRSPAGSTGQSPGLPSIDSRIRSAWPLCRAYSSIMCSRIQRRLKWPAPPAALAADSGSSPSAASDVVDHPVGAGDRLVEERAQLLRGVVGGGVPLPVAVGVPVDAVPGRHRRSSPTSTSSNQLVLDQGEVLQQPAERHRGRRQRLRELLLGQSVGLPAEECRGGSRGRPEHGGSSASGARAAAGSARSASCRDASQPGPVRASRIRRSTVGDAVRPDRPGRRQHRPAWRSPPTTARRRARTCRAISACAVGGGPVEVGARPAVSARRAVGAGAAAAGPAAGAASGTPSRLARAPQLPSGEAACQNSASRARTPAPGCRGTPGRRADVSAVSRQSDRCGGPARRVGHEAEREAARRLQHDVAVVGRTTTVPPSASASVAAASGSVTCRSRWSRLGPSPRRCTLR